jgi:hypothetical protein
MFDPRPVHVELVVQRVAGYWHRFLSQDFGLPLSVSLHERRTVYHSRVTGTEKGVVIQQPYVNNIIYILEHQ